MDRGDISAENGLKNTIRRRVGADHRGRESPRKEVARLMKDSCLMRVNLFIILA